MTVSKATTDAVKPSRPRDKEAADGAAENAGLQMGELAELLGYSLKRAQLKVFEDFLRCVAPLQLTPAQFSVLLLLDKNPGRNQTEIANTLASCGRISWRCWMRWRAAACARGCARPTTAARTSWF